MRTIKKTKIRLSMAAVILAALAIPAAAETQVPFKGAFEGSDTVIPPTITSNLAGTATHLGKFSYRNLITFPAVTGSAEWTAANGDKIYSTSVGSGIRGPLVVEITEIHTITGGTGRFSGAQGTVVLRRTHVRTPSADGTHVTFGSFEGTITSPGATQ